MTGGKEVSPQWLRHSEDRAERSHSSAGKLSAEADPRSGLLLRSRCRRLGSSEIDGGSCSRPALVRAKDVSDLQAGRATLCGTNVSKGLGGSWCGRITIWQALSERV